MFVDGMNSDIYGIQDHMFPRTTPMALLSRNAELCVLEQLNSSHSNIYIYYIDIQLSVYKVLGLFFGMISIGFNPIIIV